MIRVALCQLWRLVLRNFQCISAGDSQNGLNGRAGIHKRKEMVNMAHKLKTLISEHTQWKI